MQLENLIEYLESELSGKALQQRIMRLQPHSASDGLISAHGLLGTAAMDSYVYELVFAIKEFPYYDLRGGRQVGAWVRDKVVAPLFGLRWDFYTNKRKGLGYTLEDVVLILNELVRRLKSVQETAHI